MFFSRSCVLFGCFFLLGFILPSQKPPLSLLCQVQFTLTFLSVLLKFALELLHVPLYIRILELLFRAAQISPHGVRCLDTPLKEVPFFLPVHFDQFPPTTAAPLRVRAADKML